MHLIDKHWWQLISVTQSVPVPLQPPLKLRWYASALFAAEADEYPRQFRNHQNYPLWLSKLSDRVVERVMDAVDKIGHRPFPVSLATLSHHGATKPEIGKELREMLERLVNKYTVKDSDPQFPTREPAPPMSIAAEGNTNVKQARSEQAATASEATPPPNSGMTPPVVTDVSTKRGPNPLQTLTWDSIKHLPEIRARLLADGLRFDSRTIRNYIYKGILDRAKRGFVKVNNKLWQLLREHSMRASS